MRMLVRAALALAACAAARPTQAQELEVHVFMGSAVSAPLPITIAQTGQPDLRFTARWSTRPTTPAWYYAWRLGLWNGHRGWRLDHTHHKIYLTNPPSEVERFQITNGFNILSVSRAFRRGGLTYSFGAGPVITFPMTTVRGKERVDGYHLSGGSLTAMATREFPLVGRLVLSLDARASASWVRVPVSDGHATVPNAALHFHAGLGYVTGR